MQRMTKNQNSLNKNSCRINKCPVGKWIPDFYYNNYSMQICVNCPFKPYINKLAEYEDKEEKIEDDLK